VVSPKHIDAKEVSKLERKSEPPITSSGPGRFVQDYFRQLGKLGIPRRLRRRRDVLIGY
jgi:hypothetical protein